MLTAALQKNPASCCGRFGREMAPLSTVRWHGSSVRIDDLSFLGFEHFTLSASGIQEK
jgi:hypothetical protein